MPSSADDVFRRIGLEVGEPRHRIVVEIEAAGFDQVVSARHGEPMAFDHRREQRGRDRIGGGLFGPLAVDHFAPPLQADFAGQRLARHLAHARHLDVEGIERMQRGAMFRRREQCG